MEGRNFHTALVGGFRKKDVVNYLAEEKRLQQEQVQDLRQQLETLERELETARTDSGANRLLTEELQQRQTELQQAAELARQDKTAAQEACDRAAEQLEQALRDRTEALTALEEEQAAHRATRDALEKALADNRVLAARLEESKTVPEGGTVDREELLRLRETLRAERERACALESRLRQQSGAGAWETAGGDSRLWALCAKMERTLSQMERMLDGPYRMTCYPEPAVQRPEPVDPEAFFRDGEAAPAGVSSEPDTSAVSGLLRKIRKK